MAEREWIEAGLLDPDARDADGRRGLLAWLESEGFTLAEMHALNERRELQSAAGDRRLRPRPVLTAAEIAVRVGLTPEQIDRIFLAAGFPPPVGDVRVFSEDELVLFVGAKAAASLFGEDALLAFIRVMGASMARIAEAADAMFLADVEGPRRTGGASTVDIAKAVDQGMALLAGLPEIFAPLFRRHAMAAIERSRSAREGLSSDGGFGPHRVPLAVGFADLAGFTALAERTDPRVLACAVGQFERSAYERSIAAGVRLVKSIGDAVMVVGMDAVAVVEVMSGVVADVTTAPSLQGVRAAVVAGEVLARDGDYVGPTVNLAARATKEAPIGGIVVNEPVARLLASKGQSVEQLEPRALRGIDEPVVLSLVSAPLRPPTA